MTSSSASSRILTSSLSAHATDDLGDHLRRKLGLAVFLGRNVVAVEVARAVVVAVVVAVAGVAGAGLGLGRAALDDQGSIHIGRLVISCHGATSVLFCQIRSGKVRGIAKREVALGCWVARSQSLPAVGLR